MNERIREIAREAGIKMYHSDTLALGYLDTAHRRFAELLQEDCLQHLTNMGQDYARFNAEDEAHARDIFELYYPRVEIVEVVDRGAAF